MGLIVWGLGAYKLFQLLIRHTIGLLEIVGLRVEETPALPANFKAHVHSNNKMYSDIDRRLRSRLIRRRDRKN